MQPKLKLYREIQNDFYISFKHGVYVVTVGGGVVVGVVVAVAVGIKFNPAPPRKTLAGIRLAWFCAEGLTKSGEDSGYKI